ncbi:MAG: hypothetical protein DRJ01_02320 [Bacteroidetes bacterium]|nr:MAG: hypothetical protein DRJ01_02320 [Bacteroidota bacterium]
MKAHKIIIILGLIVLLFVNKLCSQDNVKKYFASRNEISFSISNLFQKNEEIQYSNYYPYPFYLDYYPMELIYMPYIYTPKNLSNTDNYHLFGISYKYNIFNNSAAFRVQAFFNYNSDNDEANYSSNSSNSTEYFDTRTKFCLGYEAHRNLKRTQFYYGIDFSYTYSKLSNKSTNVNEQRYYPNVNDTVYSMITVLYTNSIEDKMNTYGINPFMGIKYFITPKLSISTETQLVFEVYYEKLTQKNANNHPSYPYENTTTKNNDGFSSKFGPIGTLSISYHF